MKNILEYKGYCTRIEYSAADCVLYGKIEGIKDLVNFESVSADLIEQEFHAAVDDYLLLCEELGVAPDKAYKGSFNVRISPELHRKAAMCAEREGQTLNQFVQDAIQARVEQGPYQSVVFALPVYSRKEELTLSVPKVVHDGYNTESSPIFS